VASLHAFKQRNDDARRKLSALQEMPTTLDFAHYRSVLKNQAIVDEIEKRFAAFKPATYDVGRQLKAIDAFEVEALKNAEETKSKVNMELADLEKTLKNIETARPFEDLTVVCFRPRCLECWFRVCRGTGPVWDVSGPDMLMTGYRTRLRLLPPRLTRRRPSWCPGAAGWCRDTRYGVGLQTPFSSAGLLTRTPGKIRRPLGSIDGIPGFTFPSVYFRTLL
jgi:hypothetical protein